MRRILTAQELEHPNARDGVVHADGRPSCRRCGGSVPKPRRTFCSGRCVDEWLIRTSAAGLRRIVFRRDHGVCAVCWLNTVRALRDARAMWRRLRAVDGSDGTILRLADIDGRIEARATSFVCAVERLGFSVRAYVGGPMFNRDWWDADHIVPIVEGGDAFDLANIRTLCLPCHRHATAELRWRRSRAGRGAAARAEAA